MRQERSSYEKLLTHKVTLQQWASFSLMASQEKLVRGIQNDTPREPCEEQPSWEMYMGNGAAVGFMFLQGF